MSITATTCTAGIGTGWLTTCACGAALTVTLVTRIAVRIELPNQVRHADPLRPVNPASKRLLPPGDVQHRAQCRRSSPSGRSARRRLISP